MQGLAYASARRGDYLGAAELLLAAIDGAARPGAVLREGLELRLAALAVSFLRRAGRRKRARELAMAVRPVDDVRRRTGRSLGRGAGPTTPSYARPLPDSPRPDAHIDSTVGSPVDAFPSLPSPVDAQRVSCSWSSRRIEPPLPLVSLTCDAAGTPASPPPKPRPEFDDGFAPGKTVASRYRIVSRIGEGGMAVVFRARDTVRGEDVALKVSRARCVGPHAAETQARFRREQELATRLSHPSIVQVHSRGLHADRHYLVMELLIGDCLASRTGDPIDLERVYSVIRQTAEALSAIHAQGVVHCDIKPGNLFVTRTGLLKLADFGIARPIGWQAEPHDRALVGTPEYMAPEQIRSQRLVAATDQYALGVGAFELLTGRLPFTHDDLMPLLVMHLERTPPSPSAVNPRVPTAVSEIVLRLLAKSPDDRFASCGDVVQALSEVTRSM